MGGEGTGTKYTINFEEMRQTNVKSGYKRDVLRRMLQRVQPCQAIVLGSRCLQGGA